MKLEKIDLYYFSGTGNTLLVVKQMMKVFTENVKMHRIRIQNLNMLLPEMCFILPEKC
jgi:hypothetical protein